MKDYSNSTPRSTWKLTPQRLERAIKNFPWDSPIGYHSKAYNIAYILWQAGATSVEHTTRWSAGSKDPANLQVHLDSVIVKPYMAVKDTTSLFPGSTIPLFWYLLRKADLRYGGGAGDEKVSYAQACLSDPKEWNIMCEIVRTFQYLQKEFGFLDTTSKLTD